MANYKAYIAKGMDARLFAQLRMNALLIYNKYFFDEHEQCKNLEDVKNLRIKHLRKKCEEYDDEPWQYYYLIRYLYGKNFPYNFMFDFECFFADCDYSKFTQVENYREDLSRLI